MKLTFSRLSKTFVVGLARRPAPAGLRPDGHSEGSEVSRSPGFADGRGPSGPVTLKIVSPTPDEVIPIPRGRGGAAAREGRARHAQGGARELRDCSRTPRRSTGQRLEILVDNISSTFPWRDATKPYTFKSLPKGTHMVRIFPVRPWGEAIKEPPRSRP